MLGYPVSAETVKNAELEADLMQIDSITHIAWIPTVRASKANTAWMDNTKTTLKGHYIIRVKR